jgi:hypothetical protein
MLIVVLFNDYLLLIFVLCRHEMLFLFVIVPPNAATIAQNAAAAAAQSLALQQLTQQQTSPASGVSLSQMPQILANAQGQIVAIGSPQVRNIDFSTHSLSQKSDFTVKLHLLIMFFTKIVKLCLCEFAVPLCQNQN